MNGPRIYRQTLKVLRHVITASGTSQAELARLTGVSEKHVSRVVTGKDQGSWQFMEDCLTVLGYRFSVWFVERDDPLEAIIGVSADDRHAAVLQAHKETTDGE